MTRDKVTDNLFSLEGYVALITGATRGIGAAVVRRFVEAGAKVAITHLGSKRNELLSSALVDELSNDCVMAVVADAASESEMASAIEDVAGVFGKIDALVLNAADTDKLPWDQITIANWDRMMQVNLRGAFVASKAVVEGMRAQQYGKIITIGSVMATFGDPRALHYVTTKGGLIAFARSLSRAEGEHGIRVNCVIPGAIEVERELEEGGNPGIILERMCRVQALRYRGQPDDIAAACQYLASSAGDFVTGQTITVDGGWTNS